jgi:hypothetical protein
MMKIILLILKSANLSIKQMNIWNENMKECVIKTKALVAI